MRTHRVLAAVLASLLLHAVVISGAWLRVPGRIAEPPPLEARLVNAPPPAPAVSAEPPQPRSRLATPRRSSPPSSPLPILPTVTQLALPPPVETAAASAEPAERGPPAMETIPEPAPDPVPPTAATAPAPIRSLPAKGRITYALHFGIDKFSVGKATQSWDVEGDGYTLASDAETTGVVDAFRPQRLRYLSQGKLTTDGLRPEKFLTSRTRRGQTEVAEARFDWNAGNLTFGNTRASRSVTLPEGSQDLMSFIFQMSLMPPQPGRFRVPVTNGSRFETYEVEVFSEEDIETPLGTLKAVPVKQIRRVGAETIEIWLAAEYRYLPVKIRFLNREGMPSGEQIANEIRISEK